MYEIIKCPEHNKALVFFKNTQTHALFKCPDCDYIHYPGVVHKDLPEKFIKLQAENKRLKKQQVSCPFCCHSFKVNWAEERDQLENKKGGGQIEGMEPSNKNTVRQSGTDSGE